MEGLERVLKKHDFLKDLSTEQARFLVSCAKNVRVHAGEFLMREGREADVFYLLRTGRVALEVHVPGRGVVQMESLGPGDVLGLSWLIPPHREMLDARAVETVVAIAFDARCLRDKRDTDHDLGFAVVRRLFEQAYRRLARVRLQRLVYGPRTPTVAPTSSRAIACVTVPTARIVWTSASGRAGLPLIEIGTSPAPNA